jgi:hypothetical protein
MQLGLEDSVEWLCCASKFQELTDLFPKGPGDWRWRKWFIAQKFNAFNKQYIEPVDEVRVCWFDI